MALGVGAITSPVDAQPDPDQPPPSVEMAIGQQVSAGTALKISVPEAAGRRTILGQVAVAGATGRGFVTAYGCADGLPRNGDGAVSKADLNFDGRISPVSSNRLVVQADADGDVCLYTSSSVEMIVDLSAVSAGAISSMTNQRTDTRSNGTKVLGTESLRVNVPEALGGGTVFGQLAVGQVTDRGFITASPCRAGVPRDASGAVSRADLNFDGGVSPIASNRLIVEADAMGDVCFYASADAHLIIDVNAVATDGIDPFPNRRTDTRAEPGEAEVLSISVPEAAASKTVFGQLTVTGASGRGYVVAFGCADGVPLGPDGRVAKSDVNFDGSVSSIASNRLIVTADANGEVCLLASEPVDFVVDVNAVAGSGIEPFDFARVDTRTTGGSPETPPVTTTPTTTPTSPTTTTVPGSPPPAGIQAVLVLPADATPVLDRAAAIVSTVGAVQGWFESQTGGRHPVFQRVGANIDVITVRIAESEAQAAAAPSFESLVVPQIRAAIPSLDSESPLAIIYEGTTSDEACGRANTQHLVMAMGNCTIYPSANARFPSGMTYLLAHELTHLLGAVPGCAPHVFNGGHVNDSNRDILYSGPEQRDWSNLVLDAGNDDYFRHSIPGCRDIDDNPLLGTG